MPLAVPVPVVFPLRLSVLSRRNDGLHPLMPRLPDDGIAVAALVRDQMLGNQPFDQLASMATVRAGSFWSKDSDRQTLRIHGQMYLGVEPPLVRPIPSLPPRAPAAWGCTLQWPASIISQAMSGSSMSCSSSRSQIPQSPHRQNRRCVFFQSP